MNELLPHVIPVPQGKRNGDPDKPLWAIVIEGKQHALFDTEKRANEVLREFLEVQHERI